MMAAISGFQIEVLQRGVRDFPWAPDCAKEDSAHETDESMPINHACELVQLVFIISYSYSHTTTTTWPFGSDTRIVLTVLIVHTTTTDVKIICGQVKGVGGVSQCAWEATKGYTVY